MLRISRRSDLLSLLAILAASIVADAGTAGSIPTSTRAERAIREALPRIASLTATKGAHVGAPLFIRIFKEERSLEVWLANDAAQYKLVATYPICAFSGDLGCVAARAYQRG